MPTDAGLRLYLKESLGKLTILDYATGEKKQVDLDRRKLVRFKKREQLNNPERIIDCLNVEHISRIYLAIQSEAQALRKSLVLTRIFSACEITRFETQAKALQEYETHLIHPHNQPPDTRVAAIGFTDATPPNINIWLLDDPFLGWCPERGVPYVSFSDCFSEPRKELLGHSYGYARANLLLMASLIRAYNAILLDWHMHGFTAYRFPERSDQRET
ncbi:MAG: hypothetical protein HQL72_09240 [Magnetococcales bacterium]|nr:hypothetical protein [Magnetococcales bacterium]